MVTLRIDFLIFIALQVFQRLGVEHVATHSAVARELQILLKIPLDNYNNISVILKLTHYAGLMQHLDYIGRKSLSIYILNNALENESVISTSEEAEQALTLLSTLVSDKNEQPIGEVDMEELAEEQCLLARFIHQLRSNVADDQYLILTAAKKVISN